MVNGKKELFIKILALVKNFRFSGNDDCMIHPATFSSL
ncbi:hypothetical protein RV07_GL001082 [Enterococcus malodoratus]|nr:hypothetical protein RV07_GL001082 [Enterococcus malodoratus]